MRELAPDVKLIIFSFMATRDLTLIVYLVCREFNVLKNQTLEELLKKTKNLKAEHKIDYQAELKDIQGILHDLRCGKIAPPPVEDKFDIAYFRFFFNKRKTKAEYILHIVLPNDDDSISHTSPDWAKPETRCTWWRTTHHLMLRLVPHGINIIDPWIKILCD